MQLETPLGRRRALLRQEFRGLTVHADSGTLLARPLHKFWHVGQRPELRSAEERWLLQRRARLTLLENLDGVMIHFWMLEGVLHAASAHGPGSGVADEALCFSERPGGSLYSAFCREAVEACFTPIFEWCAGAVNAHDGGSTPQLVLLALRHMAFQRLAHAHAPGLCLASVQPRKRRSLRWPHAALAWASPNFNRPPRSLRWPHAELAWAR
jgi:hypothetical protein